METTGRILLVVGVALAAAGLLALLAARLGLRDLPGTLDWRWGDVRIVAPIGLMIVLSLVLTIVLNLLGRR